MVACFMKNCGGWEGEIKMLYNKIVYQLSLQSTYLSAGSLKSGFIFWITPSLTNTLEMGGREDSSHVNWTWCITAYAPLVLRFEERSWRHRCIVHTVSSRTWPLFSPIRIWGLCNHKCSDNGLAFDWTDPAHGLHAPLSGYGGSWLLVPAFPDECPTANEQQHTCQQLR